MQVARSQAPQELPDDGLVAFDQQSKSLLIIGTGYKRNQFLV